MAISLLVDGYNLLHATGAVALVRGPAGLAKARQRMLGQIAAGLTEQQRLATQVVFDASRSGKGGETETVFRSITVTYAVGYAEADDLLEEIIRKHPHPRTLTVVTSDSRVQRSASARRATFIGSDEWLMHIMDGPKPPPGDADQADSDPADSEIENPQLSAEEVAKWMREFGI